MSIENKYTPIHFEYLLYSWIILFLCIHKKVSNKDRRMYPAKDPNVLVGIMIVKIKDCRGKTHWIAIKSYSLSFLRKCTTQHGEMCPTKDSQNLDRAF